MNSDRLIRMRLAGVVCSPRPERRNEKAMAKRVKLVTMTSRPGATDRTVSNPTSWTMRPLAVPPACGQKVAEVDRLSRRRAGRQSQRPRRRDGRRLIGRPAFRSSARCTWPSERVAARSFRSSRRCCRPAGALQLRQRQGLHEGQDVVADPGRHDVDLLRCRPCRRRWRSAGAPGRRPGRPDWSRSGRVP